MNNSEHNNPITTLVMFHDLLGFGAALANSGGRFDSASGQIAFERIISLRENLEGLVDAFPEETEFFHFNDAVVSMLDIDVELNPFYPSGGGFECKISVNNFRKMLKFFGASALLHQETNRSETDKRIGPGGRTFVVLGNRWSLPVKENPRIRHAEFLQANIAFAEAYAADTAGSRSGFDHNRNNRFYVNETLFLVCESSTVFNKNDNALSRTTFWEDLDKISGNDDLTFPANIVNGLHDKIPIKIFHNVHNFYSIKSNFVQKFSEIDVVKSYP